MDGDRHQSRHHRRARHHGRFRPARPSAGNELFRTAQDSKRWNIFRCGPDSHNLLLFGNGPQLVDATAGIRPDDGGFSVDLTPVVQGQVRSAQRQFQLHPDRNLSIHDTWSTNGAEEVTWQWLTRADVTKTKDGFRLEQSGEGLLLTATASSPLIFETGDVSAPRQKFDSPNPGLTRLVIRLQTPAGTDGWMKVTATPARP